MRGNQMAVISFFCLKIGIFRYTLLFVGTGRIDDCSRFITTDHSLLHELHPLSNRNGIKETSNEVSFIRSDI